VAKKMARASKEAIGRYACRAAGHTSAQGVNLTRVLTHAGIYTEAGIGWYEGAATLVAMCGRNITQSADAAMHFLPMKVKVIAGAQDGPKIDEDSRLGDLLASILTDKPEDIIAAGWTLTLMSNPAEAEISVGLGTGRRVITFAGPATDRYSPTSIRSAKVVPAHVIAELAELIQNGEQPALRDSGQREAPRRGIQL
jgi:hypothetical protein